MNIVTRKNNIHEPIQLLPHSQVPFSNKYTSFMAYYKQFRRACQYTNSIANIHQKISLFSHLNHIAHEHVLIFLDNLFCSVNDLLCRNRFPQTHIFFPNAKCSHKARNPQSFLIWRRSHFHRRNGPSRKMYIYTKYCTLVPALSASGSSGKKQLFFCISATNPRMYIF